MATLEVRKNDQLSDVRRRRDHLLGEDAGLYCVKTFKLLQSHFSWESSFFSKLVMADMQSNPFVQYHFLKTYVIKMNKEIADTIRDAIYQPEFKKMADLYKTLLVIFTRRLCEFDRDNVDNWVQQEYFPAKECIEVCREMKNLLAEARLLEKLGDGKAAITLYLEFISKIDPKRMTD